MEKDSLDIAFLDEWSDSAMILAVNTNDDSLLVASGNKAMYVIDDNPPTALSTMGYYKMDDYIFRHVAVKDSFIFSMIIPRDRSDSVEVWLMEFNP